MNGKPDEIDFDSLVERLSSEKARLKSELSELQPLLEKEIIRLDAEIDALIERRTRLQQLIPATGNMGMRLEWGQSREIVVSILRARRDGLSVREIAEEASRQGHQVSRAAVSSFLSRAKRAREVQCESGVYRLVQP